MNSKAEFEKTPEFQNFKEQMGKLLKVSKKELDEHVAEYARNSIRKRAEKNGSQGWLTTFLFALSGNRKD